MSYTLNTTDADCYKGTTVPEKIESLGYAIFKRVKDCNYFAGIERELLVTEAADLYNSLNRLHPFREGNGRTERIFFSQLIRHAGYDINFSAENAELLMIGTIQAASGVMDNLVRFFDENITE